MTFVVVYLYILIVLTRAKTPIFSNDEAQTS